MRPVGKYPKSPQKLTPNCHKENSNGEALLIPSPCDKRQRVGRDVFGVKIHAGSPKVRVRQALNDANAAVVEAASDPNGVAGGNVEVPVHEFSKAEIEELLGFKIKSKNKFDYKGKCEQMLEYIKKLKVCIRWTQTREETLVSEKENLEKQLQDTVDQHSKKEECFRNKEKELEQTVSELQNVRSSLQDILSKIEAEKEALIEAKDKETEARLAAEKMQKSLTEELDKAQKEISNINQQVASLQDINKRLQEYNSSLQLYNSKLQSDAAVSAESIAKIQKEKSTMMETLSSLRGHSAALQEQLNNHKSTEQELLKKRDALLEEIERLRTDLQRVTDDRDQQATQAQALTIEVSRYRECTGKTASELERLSTVTSALEESNSTQNEHIRSLCMKLEIANRKLELAESSSMQHRLTDEEQRRKIEDLQKRLEEAELQISEGELVRRKLHNTILELKGNIRVFCRVRPLLADEESLESAVVQYPTSSENNGRGVDLVQGQGQKYSFIFDKVFPPASSQKEVFEEISQLIQSALDGYKVCIFAYGQTGSGKTHTMLGRSDIHDQRGIIPRSLEQIFKSSQSLVSQGWKFKMQASMLEIYNESIRDLLVSSKSSNCDGSSNKQYSIKHDQTGNTIVSDLTVVDVTNWSEVSSLLQRASQSRSVGKTAMNEQSSRSHCVFTLRISGVNEGTEQQVQGVLNLIDLAGSERLSRSGATGDRLKETQAINKSLSCLGDVILAIANKEPHVPFRNSKLTYLLQPCLGGDSKTLMFVNISPDAKSLNESLCSLRFAAKVNACDIGVPRRQPQARAADST